MSYISFENVKKEYQMGEVTIKAVDGVDFTVSGGIGSMSDIVRLDELGLRKVIVGKAVYENRITLKDIERWSLNE